MTSSSNIFFCFFLGVWLFCPLKQLSTFAFGLSEGGSSSISVFRSFMAVACTAEMPTKCHVWCLPFCHMG